MLHRLCKNYLLLLCFISSLACTSAQAAVTRSPYLQLATPTSIHIVWRSNREVVPSVRYGKAKDQLDQVCQGQQILTRRTKKHAAPGTPPLSTAPHGTYQFEAAITGLEPDTLYYYAVYHGDKRITPDDGSYYFRTHPVAGKERELYFWAVGDSGTGKPIQQKVHQAMIEYNRKHQRSLDMYVHVGDMAYTRGKDDEFQNKFFNMYKTTLRNTVCWAAMGNHEGHTSNGATGVGPFYDAYVNPTKGEAGGAPSGKESYYSYDYARTHFIVLNSHDLDRRPTASMAQWLREDLARVSPKKTDWIIAFWHHPPYTKGSHDSDTEHQLIEMRQHIMPILESAGVDLVLTGHSHIYERSMLIDGAYETPTVAENKVLDDGDGDITGDGAYQKSPGLKPNQGTVQVVTGHGGTTLRRKGFSPVMKRSLVIHGSTLFTITGKKLKAIMLDSEGRILDRFFIDKTKEVTPKRIAKPWKPGPPTAGKHLIPRNATWHYLAGATPPENWTSADFDISSWKLGKAGFGYGDEDDSTVLDMQHKFRSLYIRRSIKLDQPNDAHKLWLSISYDDAFILYLNGKEALRRGVGKGQGAKAKKIVSHEANGGFELIDLSPYAGLLREGNNVIAIEGHNISLKSSDFTLHPALILKTK
ncbi:metallophosphoesterase family protein [Verrucomicrobiaceae bacterium 5K15]|uniref:Metallophosphoesterase family protein n=1 Tax=Oceaniferula flava TaxID=2800421 RepID=A0AAE2SDH7_9BACT|nr:metallophosphoesterase family protein [Oceaniferula flavus]MBK1856368.1 metallophosphoesterase family protein [Oceaniferula flavus]MBM1137675.1 metallophosphoesterase family protein [Oceaniferula flavus]